MVTKETAIAFRDAANVMGGAFTEAILTLLQTREVVSHENYHRILTLLQQPTSKVKDVLTELAKLIDDEHDM